MNQDLAALLIEKYAQAIAWAVRLLFNTLVTRVVVAIAVVAFALSVTIYALWIGLILWFITGRFGIIRSQSHKKKAEVITSASMITSLTAWAFLEHRSLANTITITLLAAAGATVWSRRRQTLRALERELRSRTPAS